jgi:pimeloyl-ACP methyl ester carboxylesterase
MAGPPIILVGGYQSFPTRYRRFAGALAELSGSPVSVVGLTPLDWFLGAWRGYGQLVFEVATAVDRTLLESEHDRAVIVGHSAGGVLARVYVGGDPPYGGRRYSGHRRVSHLITLGSPHVVAEDRRRLAPIAEVNRLFPGALHAPSGLRYLCVAGAAVDGREDAAARRRYERLVDDGRQEGDGVVPVSAALLEGAERLVLDDVYHGPRNGPRWYGSDGETVRRWWPEELRASRAGLRRGSGST